MFDHFYRYFTKEERQQLLTATADDVMAPSDMLSPRLSQSLRAKFMELVIKSIPSIPMVDANLSSDPQ